MNMDCFMKRFLEVLMNDQTDHEFISIKMLTGGTTSHRIGKLLNFAVSQMNEAECYLEVGVFLGATICSAAHANNRECIGIDKYDPQMLGLMSHLPASHIRDRCLHNTKQFSSHIKLIEKDFREVTKAEIPMPVAVSFIDGEHSYKDVRDNIAWLEPFLANHAIVVFDDVNWHEVETAVQEVIATRKDSFDLVFYAKPIFNNSDYTWTLEERFLNNGMCILRYHRAIAQAAA